MNIETRITAEKSIVKNLVKECLAIGGLQSTVFVVSYEGEEDRIVCTTAKAVWENVSAVDEAYITVINQFTGKKLGVFFIVLGNDGFDCIADYSYNEFCEKVDKALHPLVDKWEQKLFG